MHLAVERQASAASMTSSKAAPLSSHPPCRKLSYSISELIHARDGQINMILERQSMPCLRLPLSYSKTVHPRMNTYIVERPGSPASTVSSRRSVSGMKQLLPLKLQPAPPIPKVDLSSWLEDTVPHLQSPITFSPDCQAVQVSPHSSPVPWMWSAQDMQLSNHIPPNRYRETPIYSDPGSPMLSRAYLSDEESCYRCPSTDSICDELCIVGSYEDVEAADSHSQTSLVDCTAAFDDEEHGSAETSPTSFASSRRSELSIQCKGEFTSPDEAAWMRGSTGKRVEAGSTDITTSPEEVEVAESVSTCEDWIDSDSSRCSSPSTQDTFFDAYATKLAPARAQLIEVTRTLSNRSKSPPPSKSYKQFRPSTPYRLSRRGATRLAIPYSRCEPCNDEDKTPKQSRAQLIQTSPLPVPKRPSAMLMPLSNPPISMLSVNSHKLAPTRHRYSDTSASNTGTRGDITEAVREFVRGFPERLLTLHTLCVINIRCRNKITRQPAASLHISNPPKLSEPYPPLTRSRRPSIRWHNTTGNFFGPMIRAASVKDPVLRHATASMSNAGTSPKGSVASKLISAPLNLPAPDLPAFRSVFPSTDDCWRNILFAHLVAYNYVCDSQILPKPSLPHVPTKVSHTLGIPRGFSNPSIASTGLDQGLVELEHELASCVCRLANYMAGKVQTLEQVKYGDVPAISQTDLTLVRALAEIVRVSEKDGEEEVGKRF